MVDRYTILGSIAKGGMAQVYLGRMVASAGFSRPVAIKRLHDTLRTDPDFVAMLVDEARLTARIRHTNVVDILDVVVRDSAFALVLEWVEGASLSVLFKRAMRAGEPIPGPIVHAIMAGTLRGLAAAHEARDEDGQPLGIVHRDVSPQNVLVGVDGIPRIIDFGVAKAFGKLEESRPGEIRGKYAYMAPEQLMGRPVTCQVDVYAAGVMMWELLTGRRLFKYDDERAVTAAVLQGNIPRPSTVSNAVSPELDDIVMRAVAREPSSRYLDAREMLAALERLERASEEEIGAWVRGLAVDIIEQHQKLLQAASPPSSVRSLEALLSELASRPASQSLSEVAESSSYPAVAPPEPATQRLRAGKGWLAALVAAAALATLALVLGVVSLATASTRPVRAQLPEPSAPASAVSLPEPAPSLSSAPAAEPVPSAPVAPPVSVVPSAAPRAKAKVRPRVPVHDPTDHR